MKVNSITGLPNPIDRDAAANKNYVDNGGAITKLPKCLRYRLRWF